MLVNMTYLNLLNLDYLNLEHVQCVTWKVQMVEHLFEIFETQAELANLPNLIFLANLPNCVKILKNPSNVSKFKF